MNAPQGCGIGGGGGGGGVGGGQGNQHSQNTNNLKTQTSVQYVKFPNLFISTQNFQPQTSMVCNGE